MRTLLRSASAAALLSVMAFHPSLASGFPSSESIGIVPRTPVSAFAIPAWFDPSRLKLSSSVSFGTGFGGGTAGLQTTSLSYQFAAPLAMRVSLGNAFGSQSLRSGSGFFLEGVDLSYRPSANTFFQVSFHDYRSALQFSRDPFRRGPWDY